MENKYLSLEGLTEYDVLSKDKMMSIGTAALLSAKEYSDTTLTTAQTYTDTALSGKADLSHSHSDLYYTKTEFDSIELITPEEIDAICGSTTSVDVVSLSEGVF